MNYRLKLFVSLVLPFVGAFLWILSFALFLQNEASTWSQVTFLSGIATLLFGACCAMAWGEDILNGLAMRRRAIVGEET